VGDDQEARASGTPSDALFSRDEVLGGLPAGRARSLLFLIENRTAHLVARSSQAMQLVPSERVERERDLAFLEAFALGQDPPLRPTIQDLERHAPEWADLVPDNPQVRAAFAHLLGQKYHFTPQTVPGLRSTLGLDLEPVQRAYRRLYRRELGAIYAERMSPIERLRWTVSRLNHWLESLPPFWTAFALTLTETVGVTTLALPIALAEVGPLAGLVLLVVLGLVNQVTIVALAESFARSGNVRYGSAFFGRLIAEYLGNVGSLLLSSALVLLCFVGLLAFYLGLSTTLASALSVPPPVWATLLFLVSIYFLSRESLTTTVGSALVVGAVNIGLILLLSLLALTHLRLDNLLYVHLPFLDGRPFEPALLGLIFGVVTASFCGHVSMGNCAKVVLRRDPSARSLIWGAFAAQVAALVVYSLWVVAVNGAISPRTLAGQAGTALIPLADQVGPSVHLFGSVYVVLGLGMGSIHLSLALFNLVREWLPTRSRPVLILPRWRGRLLFQSPGRSDEPAHLGLTYLGLVANRPRFRLDLQLGGRARRAEIDLQRGPSPDLLDLFPDLRARGGHLDLELLEADSDQARIRVGSSLAFSYEGSWAAIGLHFADVLTLPDSDRQLLNWMMRHGEVTLDQVTAETGRDQQRAAAIVRRLVDQGLIRESLSQTGSRYRAQLAPKRGRQLPAEIWQRLDENVPTPDPTGQARRPSRVRSIARQVSDLSLGERGRFLLAASPVLLIWLLAEWSLLAGGLSFAGLLSFAGVVALSLLSGMFPVLLLVATRRKGDFVPRLAPRFLAHPVVVVGIYLLYLASLFLHGLVIWQDPFERAGALIAGLAVLGATLLMLRRLAFAPRAVVELRAQPDPAQGASLGIRVGGQPTPTELRLEYPEGEKVLQSADGEVPILASLQSVAFCLPSGSARELKVWAYRVTPDGSAEGLPALLEVEDGRETKQFDLKLSNGQVLLPIAGQKYWLKLTLPSGIPA
jgi:hypothetical protein